MNMIVAADQRLGIGYRGKLLVSIPLDQQFFRRETIGKVIVMGRKTLESLPGGQPLTQRTNVILTRKKDYTCKGAVVLHSVKEALEYLAQFSGEDVYIIGGESIYEQFLPYANVIHLTSIQYQYQADAFFPDVLENGEWVMEAESEEQTYFDLEYFFRKYVRSERKQ